VIVGLGLDISEIPRIEAAIERYGEQFERKVFTDEEIAYSRRFRYRVAEHFAARFAAKEAFSKAVGTGVRMGFRWREVGVTRRPGGPPQIALTGSMLERYGHLRMHLTLSHSGPLAIAVVVLEDDSVVQKPTLSLPSSDRS
jgi:holo-[acyl-carrier protein] synthase